MRYKLSKKIIIDLTLDSSETIMFNKGGMHKINIPSLNDVITETDLEGACSVEITVQMQGDHQERFNFINKEAQKHKERQQKENEDVNENR